MSKLTEVDKLKYWLDASIVGVHGMLGLILLQLVTATWQMVALVIWAVYCSLYSLGRIIYIIGYDKNYIKIPKQ